MAASIKDLKRMCEEHFHCRDCPFSEVDFCVPECFPDNADEIVDKWAAEHPVKTYAMDFFEKFPNAQMTKSGTPKICIDRIYNTEYIDEDCCEPKCVECWNQEMKEDD